MEASAEKVPDFEVGDEVAWSPDYATQHARGSVGLRTAVEANAPDAKFGKVTGIGNDEGTYFDVEFEDGSTMTLTHHELVKVRDV